MTNMLCESAFFGVVISLLAYELGMLLKISIIRIIMTVQNT